MTQRIHIFFYTLLVLALLAITGIAAFLFGQLATNVNQNQQTPPTNALADHDTWITFSDDPMAFEKGTLVIEGASVPDVLVCDPAVDRYKDEYGMVYKTAPAQSQNLPPLEQ